MKCSLRMLLPYSHLHTEGFTLRIRKDKSNSPRDDNAFRLDIFSYTLHSLRLRECCCSPRVSFVDVVVDRFRRDIVDRFRRPR